MLSAKSVTLATDSGLEVAGHPAVTEQTAVPKLEPVRSPVQLIPLDQAVQKATKLPSEIRAMLRAEKKQEVIAAHKASQAGRLSTLRGGKKQGPFDDPTGYPSLENVLKVLNELYSETNSELDITLAQCHAFEQQTKASIEVNTENRVYLATTIATARGDIAEAIATIAEAQKSISGLEEDLHHNHVNCMYDRHDLQEIVKITEYDYSVATEINEKVDCASNSVGLFMQCYVQNDPRQRSIKLKAANGTFVEFKSKAALVALQAASKVNHASKAKKAKEDPPAKEVSEADIPADMPTMEEIKEHEKNTEWMDHITLDNIPEKCGPMDGLSGDKCYVLKDAIGQMVGEIEWVLMEAHSNLEAHNLHCETEGNNLNAQLNTRTEEESQSQIKLAQATETLNMAENELRLRVQEFKEVKGTLITRINDCNEKFQQFHEEKCGLKTIRLELYRIVGGNPYIVDCEVGEWVAQECSAECGGGSMILTRKVVQADVFGASCPPLQETIGCAENECPVDCQISDWAGWSECSKDCGGGVQSRVRGIEVQAAHGGKPCETNQEMRTCHSQACDRDCTLEEWTPWTTCTKMCGGGLMTRVKRVHQEAAGTGVCAGEHEEDPSAEGGGARAERKDCNPQPCFDNLHCNAKVDVVLVLDGSGSVGSYGFEQTKAFAKGFLQRVDLGEENAKVGIVVYSHDAVIESDMSVDKAALEAAVDAAVFAQDLTYTGAAINTALNLAQQGGRPDAQTVILVITDGVPTSKEEYDAAGRRAKEQDLTRLITVGVGHNVDFEFMSKEVTYPVEQNLLYVHDYDDLNVQIGNLVASVCPVLDCSEEFTGIGEDYRGCQDTTRSGETCQGWDSDDPHWHPHNDHWHPNKGLGGDHNFCRNPDSDGGGIWCWTLNTDVPWEYCDPRGTTSIPEPVKGFDLEEEWGEGGW